MRRSPASGHGKIAPAANIYSPKCYILYVSGPTCRGSVPLCMPPFNYKRGGIRCYKTVPSSDSQYITQWSRVLRPGGPNHSKPSCGLACSSISLVTSKTLRPLLSLGFRAGAIRHPTGEISSPTATLIELLQFEEQMKSQVINYIGRKLELKDMLYAHVLLQFIYMTYNKFCFNKTQNIYFLLIRCV
jgi:hypothetical protein